MKGMHILCWQERNSARTSDPIIQVMAEMQYRHLHSMKAPKTHKTFAEKDCHAQSRVSDQLICILFHRNNLHLTTLINHE